MVQPTVHSSMQGRIVWRDHRPNSILHGHGDARRRPYRRIRAAAAALEAPQGIAPARLEVEARQASTAAELRAAAYLRAGCFYTYPEDRSEFAARAHRRLKGDAEWASVTGKVEGTDPAYQQLRVTCVIATAPSDPSTPGHEQLLAELEPSTKLPAPQPWGAPLLVLGSLDVNQGAVLPAEESVGRLPEGDASTQRAYLSNVCVACAARRRGVAHALVAAAEQLAAQQGVRHMYVHAVHDNAAAVRLYQGSGYVLESEETEAFACSLGRPKRLLLHKLLPAPNL